MTDFSTEELLKTAFDRGLIDEDQYYVGLGKARGLIPEEPVKQQTRVKELAPESTRAYRETSNEDLDFDPFANWIGEAPSRPLEEIQGGPRYLSISKKNQRGRRGFWEELTDIEAKEVPVVGFVKEGVQLADAIQLIGKMKKGRPMTDEEKVRMNTFFQQQQRAENKTWMAQVTDAIQGTIALGMEIGIALLEPTIAGEAAVIGKIIGLAGRKAGKKAASTALKSAMKRAYTKTARETLEKLPQQFLKKTPKTFLGKLKQRGIRKGVQTTARTRATYKGVSSVMDEVLQPMIGNKAARSVISKGAGVAATLEARALPVQFTTSIGRNVESYYRRRLDNVLTSGDESQVESVLRGFLDTNIQLSSEFSGAFIGAGAAKVLNKVPGGKKMIDKLGSAIGYMLGMKHFGTANGRAIASALKGMGVNGWAEEIGEERLADFLSGLYGQEEGKAGLIGAIRNTWESITDPERMSVEITAFAFLPAMAHMGDYMSGGPSLLETLEAHRIQALGEPTGELAQTQASIREDALKVVEAIEREDKHFMSRIPWVKRFFTADRFGTVQSSDWGKSLKRAFQRIDSQEKATEEEKKAQKTELAGRALGYLREVQVAGIQTEEDAEEFRDLVNLGRVTSEYVHYRGGKQRRFFAKPGPIQEDVSPQAMYDELLEINPERPDQAFETMMEAIESDPYNTSKVVEKYNIPILNVDDADLVDLKEVPKSFFAREWDQLSSGQKQQAMMTLGHSDMASAKDLYALLKSQVDAGLLQGDVLISNYPDTFVYANTKQELQSRFPNYDVSRYATKIGKGFAVRPAARETMDSLAFQKGAPAWAVIEDLHEIALQRSGINEVSNYGEDNPRVQKFNKALDAWIKEEKPEHAKELKRFGDTPGRRFERMGKIYAYNTVNMAEIELDESTQPFLGVPEEIYGILDPLFYQERWLPEELRMERKPVEPKPKKTIKRAKAETKGPVTSLKRAVAGGEEPVVNLVAEEGVTTQKAAKPILKKFRKPSERQRRKNEEQAAEARLGRSILSEAERIQAERGQEPGSKRMPAEGEPRKPEEGFAEERRKIHDSMPEYIIGPESLTFPSSEEIQQMKDAIKGKDHLFAWNGIISEPFEVREKYYEVLRKFMPLATYLNEQIYQKFRDYVLNGRITDFIHTAGFVEFIRKQEAFVINDYNNEHIPARLQYHYGHTDDITEEIGNDLYKEIESVFPEIRSFIIQVPSYTIPYFIASAAISSMMSLHDSINKAEIKLDDLVREGKNIEARRHERELDANVNLVENKNYLSKQERDYFDSYKLGSLSFPWEETPLDVAKKHGVIYRGLRRATGGQTYQKNKDGSLTLYPQANFEGKQMGVSFTPYRFIAFHYANEGHDFGSAEILEVDLDENLAGQLEIQSDEEIEFQKTTNIPAGKWRIRSVDYLEKVSPMTAEELKDWENLSDGEEYEWTQRDDVLDKNFALEAGIPNGDFALSVSDVQDGMVSFRFSWSSDQTFLQKLRNWAKNGKDDEKAFIAMAQGRLTGDEASYAYRLLKKSGWEKGQDVIEAIRQAENLIPKLEIALATRTSIARPGLRVESPEEGNTEGEWLVRDEANNSYRLFDTEEEARQFVSESAVSRAVPLSEYESLTVNKGQGEYKEYFIHTPFPVPGQHGEFQDPNLAGWFRVREYADGTLEVQEIQSELFQKNKDIDWTNYEVSLANLQRRLDEAKAAYAKDKSDRNQKAIDAAHARWHALRTKAGVWATWDFSPTPSNTFLNLMAKDQTWVPVFVNAITQWARNRGAQVAAPTKWEKISPEEVVRALGKPMGTWQQDLKDPAGYYDRMEKSGEYADGLQSQGYISGGQGVNGFLALYASGEDGKQYRLVLTPDLTWVGERTSDAFEASKKRNLQAIGFSPKQADRILGARATRVQPSLGPYAERRIRRHSEENVALDEFEKTVGAVIRPNTGVTIETPPSAKERSAGSWGTSSSTPTEYLDAKNILFETLSNGSVKASFVPFESLPGTDPLTDLIGEDKNDLIWKIRQAVVTEQVPRAVFSGEHFEHVLAKQLQPQGFTKVRFPTGETAVREMLADRLTELQEERQIRSEAVSADRSLESRSGPVVLRLVSHLGKDAGTVETTWEELGPVIAFQTKRMLEVREANRREQHAFATLPRLTLEQAQHLKALRLRLGTSTNVSLEESIRKFIVESNVLPPDRVNIPVTERPDRNDRFKFVAERYNRNAFENRILAIDSEIQQLKTQGIEKLAPIEAFYENRVGKIVERMGAVLVTDANGNTWREVSYRQAGLNEEVNAIQNPRLRDRIRSRLSVANPGESESDREKRIEELKEQRLERVSRYWPKGRMPTSEIAEAPYDRYSIEKLTEKNGMVEVPLPEYMQPERRNLTWAQKAQNSYEVSSKGDKRFSALYAKLPDGRTIEEAYQLDVKGYREQGNNWRKGKGKPPLKDISRDEQWLQYKDLWRQYLDANPELESDLINKVWTVRREGNRMMLDIKTLTDQFAETPINQARALAELLSERNNLEIPEDATQQSIRANYKVRTMLNVDASKMTVIMEPNKGVRSAGTLKTLGYAQHGEWATGTMNQEKLEKAALNKPKTAFTFRIETGRDDLGEPTYDHFIVRKAGDDWRSQRVDQDIYEAKQNHAHPNFIPTAPTVLIDEERALKAWHLSGKNRGMLNYQVWNPETRKMEWRRSPANDPHKPYVILRQSRSIKENIKILSKMVDKVVRQNHGRPIVINVAGSRESISTGMFERTRNILNEYLKTTHGKKNVAGIISGGQTGADQGALQAAMDNGVPIGGYVTEGYVTEDTEDQSNRIPQKYIDYAAENPALLTGAEEQIDNMVQELNREGPSLEPSVGRGVGPAIRQMNESAEYLLDMIDAEHSRKEPNVRALREEDAMQEEEGIMGDLMKFVPEDAEDGDVEADDIARMAFDENVRDFSRIEVFQNNPPHISHDNVPLIQKMEPTVISAPSGLQAELRKMYTFPVWRSTKRLVNPAGRVTGHKPVNIAGFNYENSDARIPIAPTTNKDIATLSGILRGLSQGDGLIVVNTPFLVQDDYNRYGMSFLRAINLYVNGEFPFVGPGRGPEGQLRELMSRTFADYRSYENGYRPVMVVNHGWDFEDISSGLESFIASYGIQRPVIMAPWHVGAENKALQTLHDDVNTWISHTFFAAYDSVLRSPLRGSAILGSTQMRSREAYMDLLRRIHRVRETGAALDTATVYETARLINADTPLEEVTEKATAIIKREMNKGILGLTERQAERESKGTTPAADAWGADVLHTEIRQHPMYISADHQIKDWQTLSKPNRVFEWMLEESKKYPVEARPKEDSKGNTYFNFALERPDWTYRQPSARDYSGVVWRENDKIYVDYKESSVEAELPAGQEGYFFRIHDSEVYWSEIPPPDMMREAERAYEDRFSHILYNHHSPTGQFIAPAPHAKENWFTFKNHVGRLVQKAFYEGTMVNTEQRQKRHKAYFQLLLDAKAYIRDGKIEELAKDIKAIVPENSRAQDFRDKAYFRVVDMMTPAPEVIPGTEYWESLPTYPAQMDLPLEWEDGPNFSLQAASTLITQDRNMVWFFNRFGAQNIHRGVIKAFRARDVAIDQANHKIQMVSQLLGLLPGTRPYWDPELAKNGIYRIYRSPDTSPVMETKDKKEARKEIKRLQKEVQKRIPTSQQEPVYRMLGAVMIRLDEGNAWGPDSVVITSQQYSEKDGWVVGRDNSYNAYDELKEWDRTHKVKSERIYNLLKPEWEKVRGEVNAYMKDISEGEFVEKREAYVKHLYTVESVKEMIRRHGVEAMPASTKERKFDTYREAYFRYGLVPRTTNPLDLFGYWHRDMWNSTVHRKFFDLALGMRTMSGRPAIVPLLHQDYEGDMIFSFDAYHRVYRNMVEYLREQGHQVETKKLTDRLAISKELSNLLDQYRSMEFQDFRPVHGWMYSGVQSLFVEGGQIMDLMKILNGRPMNGKAIQFIRTFNELSKSLGLAFSAFHPVALLESLGAGYGLTIDNPLLPQNWKDTYWTISNTKAYLKSHPDMVKPWRDKGLKISFTEQSPDIDNLLVNRKLYEWAQRLMSRDDPAEYLGNALMIVHRMKKDFDNWLWSGIHPTFKFLLAQESLAQAELWAAKRGEELDRDQTMEEIAEYVNWALGGIEWTQYPFMTPNTSLFLHLGLFAPDWSLAAANISGLTTATPIARLLGRRATKLQRELMFKKYWPAMLGIVVVGLPNMMQFGIHMLAGGGDDDHKPFTFMNETGKKTHIDITPLARLIWDGPPTGKRRAYLRWAKQFWEVWEGWLQKPGQNLLNKSSSSVRWAFEQVTRQSTGGWDLEFKGQGPLGVLWTEEDGFWGSRAGYTVKKFIPLSFLTYMQTDLSSFFAPTSKGMNTYKATTEMAKIIDAVSKDDTWEKINEYDGGSKLRLMVGHILDASERNGYDTDLLFNRAVSHVKTKLYGQFWRAINENNTAEMERIAVRLERLGSTVDSVKKSMKRKSELYNLPFDDMLSPIEDILPAK